MELLHRAHMEVGLRKLEGEVVRRTGAGQAGTWARSQVAQTLALVGHQRNSCRNDHTLTFFFRTQLGRGGRNRRE